VSPQSPASTKKLKVALLLGAEPYQALHVADIAFELAKRPDVAVELVSTLAESLAEITRVAPSECDCAITRHILRTPWHLRVLQKLAIFGSVKTAVMRYRPNVEMLSRYDAIVTPTDHARVLRPLLRPTTAMVYVNHGIGGRAASYSDKYLGFDYVVVASRKDEERLLEERRVRPGNYVVAYPKFETAERLARATPPLFANDRPIVLFNPHSKRSLRSWERFAKPLIDHAARTGEFNLIVAPHVKMFHRRPRFVWRRWERLAVADRIIIDLGSPRSLDMTYTMAADIYAGDVSSQVAEFLTRPRSCVFLNAHGFDWHRSKDFPNWDLGDVAETPEEAIAAIRHAFTRHHDLYEPRQRERIDATIDRRPGAAARAADAISKYLGERRRGSPTRVMTLVSDLATGGTGRATMLTVNGLAGFGIPTSLVVVRRGGILEPGLDHRVKFFALERGSVRGAGMLLALRKLVATIRAEQPSRLLSAGNHMHVLATLAHAIARVPGCELVLKMTNPVKRPGRPIANTIRRMFYHWAFRRAERVLVIAEPTKRELAKAFPRAAGKLEVVNNPYISDAMLAVGKKEHSFERGRLIAIGRLVPQKNYPLLLSALAQIRDLAWTIDILGDGPLLSELQKQARECGIATRVHFRGYVPDPVPYLRNAHALVLSSDWEGQGAVLLEALACGCPVIATRSSDAVASVLDNGRYGRLVPPRDSAALAAATAAELEKRSKLPESVGEWVGRYRIDAGVRSHARVLGIAVGVVD
jgi:glycosyltransferase involved in cell wall biosynthesis